LRYLIKKPDNNQIFSLSYRLNKPCLFKN